jgi:O-antigen ligase
MGFFFVLIYLTACYLRPTDIYEQLAPYRPMMWLALFTGVLVLFDAIRTRSNLRAPQYWLMALFMCVLVLSRTAQGWVGGGLYALVDFIVPAAVFYFVALSVTSLGRLKILSGLLLFLFCFLAVQSLVGYARGNRTFYLRQFSDSEEDFRAGYSNEEEDALEEQAEISSLGVKRIRSIGFLNDPNDFAQTLLLGIPLLGRLWVPGRKLRNLLWTLLPGSLLLLTIYLTHSRGALVGMLALTLLFIRDRWGNRLAIFCTVLSVPLLVAAKLFLRSGESGLIDASSYGRIAAWSEGLEMLKHQPFLGVGYNFFVDHNDLTAHNSFVLCFAELGLIGYFVWLAILVITAAQLVNFMRPAAEDEDDADSDVETADTLKSWAGTLRYALCAFLVTAFFLSRTYVLTLYLLVGMTVALQALSRNSESPVEGPSPKQWMTWTTGIEFASIVAVYIMVRVGHMFG